jgi:hypothetical protein
MSRLVRRFVLCIATCILPATPVLRAQGCPDSTPLDGMVIGPMTIASVLQPTYTVSGEDYTATQTLCSFQWKGQGGTFELKNSLKGSMSNLSVTGNRTTVPGVVSLPSGGLQFDLHLTRALRASVLGGTITIPSNTNIHVTNVRAIDTRGTVGRGTLQFSVSSLSLSDGKLDMPYGLPELTLSFQSTSPITLETDVGSSATKITNGNFTAAVGVNGAKYAGQTFSIAQPLYRATVRQLHVGGIQLTITGSSVTASATDLFAQTSYTTKATTTLKKPIYATGRVSMQRILGRTTYSDAAAAFPNFELSRFAFKPAALPGAHSQFYSDDEVAASAALAIPTLDEDQQDAVNTATTALASKPPFNGFASVPASDVSEAIKPFFAKHGFTTPQQFNFGQQQITTYTTWNGGTLKVPFRAYFKITPSVQDSNLLVALDIDLFKMDEVPATGTTNSNTLLASVTDSTNSAEEPLEVQDPVSIPIDTQIIKGINLSSPASVDAMGTVSIQATPVTLSLGFTKSVLLLDSDGIHILSVLVIQ